MCTSVIRTLGTSVSLVHWVKMTDIWEKSVRESIMDRSGRCDQLFQLTVTRVSVYELFFQIVLAALFKKAMHVLSSGPWFLTAHATNKMLKDDW